MRYIGGAEENIDLNFIGAAAHANGIFNIAGAPNAAAVLANFLEFGRAANPLDAFGGVNIGALNSLREIVTTYYPNAARFLRSLADGGAALRDDDAGLLAEILVGGTVAGFTAVAAVADLGNFTTINAAEAEAAIESLRNGVCAEIRKSAENGKPSFGACPQLAVKFRCYLPTFRTIVYAKAGFTRLSGTARFDNGIPNRNFNKIATVIGFGAERNVRDRLNIGVEVTKTMQTSSDIGSVRILGKDVQQKVRLRNTQVSVFATYCL
jgi:hypothetical protein